VKYNIHWGHVAGAVNFKRSDGGNKVASEYINIDAEIGRQRKRKRKEQRERK
jgi:hypothetical protein